MSDIDIYQFLSPEEGAEHRRLSKLIELAESPAPLTVAQIAELAGLSPETIRLTEQRGLHKLKKAILTTCPEILKP